MRMVIRPLPLVVETSVPITGELFDAWHSATPTVSIRGLRVVRPINCRIAFEKVRQGRRNSRLCRCIRVKRLLVLLRVVLVLLIPG